jgi:hypothetical protein
MGMIGSRLVLRGWEGNESAKGGTRMVSCNGDEEVEIGNNLVGQE